MSDPVLTTEILIVFGLLGLAVVLFVFDWLRVDLVGILMMISLPLTGVLTGVIKGVKTKGSSLRLTFFSKNVSLYLINMFSELLIYDKFFSYSFYCTTGRAVSRHIK